MKLKLDSLCGCEGKVMKNNYWNINLKYSEICNMQLQNVYILKLVRGNIY